MSEVGGKTSCWVGIGSETEAEGWLVGGGGSGVG